ncbi:MAG: hypothetical protein ISEC1_P1713 [Thiomicrorhabdus sp.]|nr:MAG: hypothetical protein ISEC1_P1713 [Thiomicrorhabdus sp.]
MSRVCKSYWWKALLICLGLLGVFNELLASTEAGVANGATTESGAVNRVFATVNGFEIPRQVFVQTVRSEIRSKYYHGRVSDVAYKQLLHEVSQRLIDNALLMLEAEKRGINPSAEKVDKDMFTLLSKFNSLPEDVRDQAMMSIRQQLESRERIKILEVSVRDKVNITESMARQYYDQNSELFVVPLERKLSLILIKVSPNSLSAKWSEAKDHISDLRERILNGESFSVIAKRYSDDETADIGGDMGFLHEGVLSEEVEVILRSLKKGELSEPIRILEGYVLVRLEAVKKSFKKPYTSQKERAHRLLSSKLKDEAWNKFVKHLRQNALIIQSELLAEMMQR